MGIWINQEQSDNGVQDVYSPQNIIMVQDVDYDKHRSFRFGSYVEAYEYRWITNNMEEQTVSGVLLDPTAKFQGSYKISYLKTGRVLTCKQKIR